MSFSASLVKPSRLLLYLFEKLNSGLFVVDVSHPVQKTTFDPFVGRNRLSKVVLVTLLLENPIALKSTGDNPPAPLVPLAI